MHPFNSKFVTVVPLTLRGIITMYLIDQTFAIAQIKIQYLFWRHTTL